MALCRDCHAVIPCHCHLPPPVQIRPGVYAAGAIAENEERDWWRTGRIPCSDCGTVVRTSNLETLPAHGCSDRQ